MRWFGSDTAVWHLCMYLHITFAPLHCAQIPTLQSCASPHGQHLDLHYSRMCFGSRRLQWWVFSVSVLLFTFLITSASLSHVQWGGQTSMWRHVWKKSRLPQCLTITGTLPSSTFPNRAFVNRKEEFFQAIVGWALWKESLPSVPSIYFCVVFISCHHKPTCSCTMNWTEELIWLKTHTAEREKKKKKSYFPASSVLWSHLPVYHMAAQVAIQAAGR